MSCNHTPTSFICSREDAIKSSPAFVEAYCCARWACRTEAVMRIRHITGSAIVSPLPERAS